MALVCTLNIALNFIYVFKTSLGFRGIALATASSVFIGSLINLIWVKRLMHPTKSFAWDPVRRMANWSPPGLMATRLDGSLLDFECPA